MRLFESVTTLTRVILGLFLTGAVLALVACHKAKTPPQLSQETVIARVGKEAIKISDVEKDAIEEGFLEKGEKLDPKSPEFYASLDTLIDRKLLMQEALRLGLDRDFEVRKKLETAREAILSDSLIAKHLEKTIDERKVRALYEAQQHDGQGREEVRARQILTNSEDKAALIRKLLDSGAAFDRLALKESIDPNTRFNGGDLGYFTLDSMPEIYSNALRSAKIGDTIGPLKTDLGYVILKLEDRRAEKPLSLQEAWPQIIRFLNYDEIHNFLETLRKKNKTEILIPKADAKATNSGPGTAPAGGIGGSKGQTWGPSLRKSL